MPRKQKESKVSKEYGVINSSFHQEGLSLMDNQIVQLNIPMDDEPKDPLQYNPDIVEPMGMEDTGLGEFQQIQSQSLQQKELDRKEEQQRLMNLKNKEIEDQLATRLQRFTDVSKNDMLQWVDLDMSKAFMDSNVDWPNVNTPCQWCLEKFNGMSWPLVVGRNKNGQFKVRGNHCDPSCALAHGMDSREISENIPISKIYSWMMAFIYKVTGDYDTIRPAPPRFMLQKFGGPMTLDMFRKESSMQNYSSYLTYPPLETSLPIWNRIKTNTKEDNDDDTLVLKRNKPFYDQKSSLDSIWRTQSVS